MKEIKNYPNYKITKMGEVISYAQKNPKKLKPQKTTQNGKYLQVRLYGDDARITNKGFRLGKLYYLHRLMWETYKGEIPEKMTIDHIDGDPSNNRIDNLQLMSVGENSSKHNGKRKILWELRDEIIQMWKSGKTQPQIAKHYGCSTTHIWRIINGKVQTRKNGKWIYKDLM